MLPVTLDRHINTFVALQKLEKKASIQMHGGVPEITPLSYSFCDWIKRIFFCFRWKPENRRYKIVSAGVENFYNTKIAPFLEKLRDSQLTEVQKTLSHLSAYWNKMHDGVSNRLNSKVNEISKVLTRLPPVRAVPIQPKKNATLPLVNQFPMNIVEPTPGAAKAKGAVPLRKIKIAVGLPKEIGEFITLDTYQSMKFGKDLKAGEMAIVQRSGSFKYQLVKIIEIVGTDVIFDDGSPDGFSAKPAISFSPILKPSLKSPQASPKPVKQEDLEDEQDLEPSLNSEELGFEDEEDIGPRTRLAMGFVEGLEGYNASDKFTLSVGGQPCRVITGELRRFSVKPIISIGSSFNREIVYLNPDISPELDKHYLTLSGWLQKIQKASTKPLSTEDVLYRIKRYVREFIFTRPKGQNREKLERLVEKARTNKNYTKIKHVSFDKRQHKTVEHQIPVIPLEKFVKKHTGLCRHHALVTCYLIDRLMQEKKPLLSGFVQHIRNNVASGGAHVWVCFVPKCALGERQEMWHLDTLWDRLADASLPDSRKKLEKSYTAKSIEHQIMKAEKVLLTA